MPSRTASLAALATVAAAGSLVGAVSAGAQATPKPDSGAGAKAAAKVKVTLGAPTEFKLTATPAGVKAGSVTFLVTNKGKIVHEMVVVPLPTGQTKLATKNGRAVQKGALGEAHEMAAGKSKTLTVTLEPGKYQLVCNLPGHFAGGMFANFKVS
jgi:uncharacterized cupredoxin-like copper-binding protein